MARRPRGKARARVRAFLRNEKALTPLPEAQLAFQQREQALRRVAAQPHMVEADDHLWPIVCQEHGWRPEPNQLGVQPPLGICPMCNAVPEQPEGKVVYLDGGGPVKQTTPEQDKLYQAWLAKEQAAGRHLSGTKVERQALQRADDLRDEAIRRDSTPRNRRGMKLVYSNPFSGVEVWRPIRRRRARAGGQLQLPLDSSGRIIVSTEGD